MKLSAVIVNYRDWAETRALSGALLASAGDRADLEIVVVDNGADEETARSPSPLVGEGRGGGAVGSPTERLARDRRLRVIQAAGNGGFGAGVNLGAAAAKGDYLLVMNPDLRLPERFVPRVLELIRRGSGKAEGIHPENAIVGFAFCGPDGRRQHSAGYFPRLWSSLLGQFYPRARRKYRILRTRRPQRVDWVTGACFLISRALFERLGGMDERFFLYYEEVDLCRRARDLGADVWYDPRITLVHLDPLENRRPSPALVIATRHSQLLYFQKHVRRAERLALASVVAIEARLRRLGRRRRSSSGAPLPLEYRAWEVVAAAARDLVRGRLERGKDYVERLRASACAGG